MAGVVEASLGFAYCWPRRHARWSDRLLSTQLTNENPKFSEVANGVIGTSGFSTFRTGRRLRGKRAWND